MCNVLNIFIIINVKLCHRQTVPFPNFLHDMVSGVPLEDIQDKNSDLKNRMGQG